MFDTIYAIFIGSVTFWLWGIFTKGFAENVQSYYGKKFISFLNLKAKLLEKQAEKTICQIDNILLNLPVDVLDKIEEILNAQNVEQKTLIDQTYKITTLLEKYHEQLNITENKVHN